MLRSARVLGQGNRSDARKPEAEGGEVAAVHHLLQDGLAGFRGRAPLQNFRLLGVAVKRVHLKSLEKHYGGPSLACMVSFIAGHTGADGKLFANGPQQRRRNSAFSVLVCSSKIFCWACSELWRCGAQDDASPRFEGALPSEVHGWRDDPSWTAAVCPWHPIPCPGLLLGCDVHQHQDERDHHQLAIADAQQCLERPCWSLQAGP